MHVSCLHGKAYVLQDSDITQAETDHLKAYGRPARRVLIFCKHFTSLSFYQPHPRHPDQVACRHPSRKRYKDIINNALRLVSMDTKGERRLGELSGGEMQRVLFAQALIPFPDLLILDEPGAGIDSVGARVIEEIILVLKKQKVTMVWINHDLKQVKQMADAVTCIHKQVLFSGTPDEVLTTERVFQAFGTTSHGP
jgi:ABC-type Mn2+/Zn2+ transport system ATPase subunit